MTPSHRALAAVLSVALSVASPSVRAQTARTFAPKPTSAAITREDLMTRTYIIADDSMEGRDTGRRGGLRSANYIANELRRLGLRPAGDGGTFFQQIPWVARTPDSLAVLRAGSTTFAWNRDFLVIPKIGFATAIGGQPFGGGFDGTNVPTIYGGRIGDSAIAPAEVQGKVVVFSPPATGASFTFWQRDNLRRYVGARAILVATLDIGAPAAYRATRETYWDPTGSAGLLPLTVISITRAAGASLFGRPLDSLAVRTEGAALSGRAGFIDTPTEAPAYNVVGILPGSDPGLATTYVAVGAHHDHVGMGPAVDHDSIRAFNQVVRVRGADDPQPRAVTPEQTQRIRALLDSLHAAHGVRRDSIFNGADDDGSGSVLTLEIAEYYARAANRPKRSLVFVFHTAEERGLYGAQFYSDHPTVPRDSIVAMINMDQMGRGEAIDNQPGGPNALVLIGTRRLSTELGDMVEAVNARTPAPFSLDYSFDKNGDPTNAYCRSDHYMYARFGIPVAFFSAAAWHIDYHMVSDEPQYVQYDRMVKIGRYIADVVGNVANLSHRPLVDKSRPDPNAMCRQ